MARASATEFRKGEISELEVASRYLAGESIAKLSKSFSCQTRRISEILNISGVAVRMHGAGRRVLALEPMIVSLYSEGKSSCEVSKLVGVNQTTVWNVLNRNGLQIRKQRIYSEEERSRIVSMYVDEKMSTTDIADVFSTGVSMIMKILKLKGIVMRPVSQTCGPKKRFLFVKKDGGTIFMRSSYEVGFAEWMDSRGMKWEYESKTFPIGKGKLRGWTYTPDFFIADENRYVDVKGFFRPKQKDRIDRFVTMYPDIRLDIFDEQYLMSLGVKTHRRKRWHAHQVRIDSSPAAQKCADENAVNSVEPRTGDAEGNTEPSRSYDPEGVTTIPRGSRVQADSKRSAPGRVKI